MLYENYVDLKVYNSQSRISLPRYGEDADGSQMPMGKGCVIFLLTPNIKKSLEVLKDDTIGWSTSMYKNFTMDTYFRRRIGTKNIVANERNKIANMVKADKDLAMAFQTPLTVKTVVNAKRNLVVDLSRWMDLFFTYYNVMNVKKKAEAFFSLLNELMNSPRFESYRTRILMIDLESWCSASSCVLMNKRLLTNPLSMLFYTAYYYPDIWDTFKGHRVMITNRKAKQVLLFNTSDVSKKTYPKIKSKMKLLRDVVFSVEDGETTDELTDEEVQAEIVQDFKSKTKKALKTQIENDEVVTIPDPFTEPEKKDVIDLTEDLEEEPEEETIVVDDGIADSTDDAISDAVDQYVDNTDGEAAFDDPKEAASKISSIMKKNIYLTSFMPQRSEAQIEKNKRLAVNQDKALNNPTKDQAAKKIIDTTAFSPAIENTNPNLMSSKFTNFDKNYVEKCFISDIDNAVAGLSEASAKIFVTNKEVIDSSTPMDLKETWVYTLEDERGNTKTIRIDVPKVIDGTYVFLNGSMKLITHQFVLKPLVKTSEDTVQLVTAYNKVFIRRAGQVDANTNNIIVYLQKNKGKYKAREGNYSMMNRKYDVPLDFIMLCKYFGEFTIGDIKFMMDIDEMLEYVKKHYTSKFKMPNFAKEIPVGINTKTHELMCMQLDQSYTEMLMNQFSDSERVAIGKIKRKPRLIVANMKMAGEEIPAVMFCLYCEGFASVMRKANIQYEFIDSNEWRKRNKTEWDAIQLEDCIMTWRKKGIATALLMNGLKSSPFENYTKLELESKDTFISLISRFHGDDTRFAYTMDNYKDFLLDAKSKEILADFDFPTDLIEVILTAINMLSDNQFLPENNMENMRVRSAEVISDIVYLVMTQAYEEYRKQAYKKNPMRAFAVKQSSVIDALLRSSAASSKGKKREIVTNLVTDVSVLNPVHELEKARAVTFKGLRGIQLDRALTLPRRAYDKTMLGVCGITTAADANVGVVRQLTLEPNITSTRGYIDTSSQDNPDDLNSSQLFTTAELLTPIGVTHDDPDRTSMSYKQTKYMIPVEDSDPVLIGNRVEAITPYILSDEFVVAAKQDGKVIDIDGGYVIIEYKDGTRQAIDINPRVKKNASAGFYVDNTLKCDLKIGDKFKKDDVLAYNDKAFTKHKDDPGASMNLGVLTKVAVVSSWDIYEDSTPITNKLANQLATEMIAETPVTLSPNTIIDHMVKVGDQIKTGEPLIKFSETMSDEMQNLFNSMRDQGTLDEITEDTKTTISAKYTGVIADIKIYTTVPVDELDPSLAKIVRAYNNKVDKRNSVLKKYENPGDMNYYKAGQIITETSDLVTPNSQGKVKGNYIDKGVLILIYIKYRDIAAKGDKICANFALKGITSHVIEEGYEPYSEYRPDEEISTIVAPLSIAARKVPSIFLAMFGNKLLIEAKRQLREIYLGKE